MYITLSVTAGVIRQVGVAGSSQRQIAIKGASPDLLQSIISARAHKHALIAVNGVFELSVGDTGAIWSSHQTGLQAEDFGSLYDLLARRPDLPVTFTWGSA